MRRIRSFARVVIGIVFLAPAYAFASGDHHDAAPTPAPVQISPRGHAVADGVEAVAVAAPEKRLVLYLDRVPKNEPVIGAVVEVDADGFVLKLRDVGEGIYVANDWFPTPGPNRLQISYRAAAVEGKIDLTVDVPQVGGRTQSQIAASAVRIEQANIGLVAAAAVALYGLAMALFFWRARRQRVPVA